MGANAQDKNDDHDLAWLRLPDEALRERVPAFCWPFPAGSQNHTEKAVKLKPYVPPKRRSLNQF